MGGVTEEVGWEGVIVGGWGLLVEGGVPQTQYEGGVVGGWPFFGLGLDTPLFVWVRGLVWL